MAPLILPPRMNLELKGAKFDQDLLLNDFEHLLHYGSLYFYGPAKAGKTLMACAIFQKATQLLANPNDWTMDFEFVPQLLENLRPNSSSGKNLEWYQEVDWLILDDIGIEKMSEWAYDRLYLLINHRYAYLKATIFTSNFSLGELAERMQDPRIVWRIADMSHTREFTLKNFKK